MWNDWHDDVKKSAAQCLGKTSHGRDVHDELRIRLTSHDEMTRLEAINKAGQLGRFINSLKTLMKIEFLKLFSVYLSTKYPLSSKYFTVDVGVLC